MNRSQLSHLLRAACQITGDRLVSLEDDETGEAEAVCLDPHDAVIAKLVAGRDKDHLFANALVGAGLVDVSTLRSRAELLEDVPIRARVERWLSSVGD